MTLESQPGPVLHSVLATVFFTQANKPLGYGHGFVVRFAVAPKVGDIVEVDQYSIKAIPQQELHVSTWRVVDVRHEINLHTEEEKQDPLSSLRVIVHPHE